MRIPAVYGGGSLLEIKYPAKEKIPELKPPEPGKKKRIQGFSAKSRYNLAKELSRMVWPITPAHLSLTYHNDWPDNPKEHLPALRKWLERRDIFGFWGLEFQQRLAPHFHVLGCPFTEDLEDELRWYWAHLSGNGAQAAVKVTYRDEGRSAWYLALHTCKGEQRPDDMQVGRWWGKINGPAVEEHQVREDFGTLSVKQTHTLMRIARRLSGGKLKLWREQSFSVFMNEHTQHRLLRYLATVDGHDLDGMDRPF